jgi:mono/diheme cytochrome c family protein
MAALPGVTGQVGATRVVLNVTRAGSEPWQIDVWLRDRWGRPVAADAVSLHFAMPLICTQEVALAPQQVAPGHYKGAEPSFSMTGSWQATVVVQRGLESDQTLLSVPITVAEELAITPPPMAFGAGEAAAGRLIYQAHCISCHGDGGRGDGPAAAQLDPPPPDLTQHMVLGKHTDQQIFLFVHRGIPGSGMPAFNQQLSASEIWQLVAYLRTLPDP